MHEPEQAFQTRCVSDTGKKVRTGSAPCVKPISRLSLSGLAFQTQLTCVCLGHVNSKPINGNASYHSLKQAVQVHGQGTVKAAHEESQGGEEEQKRF